MKSKRTELNGNPLQTGAEFPNARYFQIHFQYLHEIIGDLKVQVDKANQQIAELQLQIQDHADSNN
ncbi:MAG: hypothetical protein CTY34_04735 [Methylobacter sp.]|nr:MAG: hypothetical protein CTY34_04735 [Methylobacter sp.]PPD02691.1 MAG: hypothetical protein CTY29_12200 [Methylobacter sp.]PPD32306.1 MAG: hypothetical protein CTY18_10845 [Methylomonas sp.]